MDLENVSETLLEKNIKASQMKFGFLGLGIMGSGIVKNLLNSGHKVHVWNRTAAKVSPSFALHSRIKQFLLKNRVCELDYG